MERLERFWLTLWDGFNSGRKLKLFLAAILAWLLVAAAVGVYWSFEPDRFDVGEQARLQTATEQPVTGAYTVTTLIHQIEMLLEKPGGYISNDILPPGIWLDNMPAWEFGVLVQVRDMSRALRKSFSRSQSQSTEDPALAKAEPLLHFDHRNWILPSSESEYRKALKHLRDYRTRLVDTDKQDAQFYARADNLRDWLDDVSTRLGSLSQRLSASVGQRRINTDLAGDSAGRQATVSSDELEIKTPRLQVDNVFYEARGTAWALIHMLEAVERDFGDALDKKNARASVRQIIRELEATQSTVWSPVILNGTEFGFLANHSLVMASYISRANAAIIDLRDLLSQG
ncbi:DUF2333 family protein [Marinobacterium marinum]|uniref:DUF2333 family protein n=1 Tax=Marinobacterium marinum TaxID=2756129 RepID=A0A7W2ABS7_9GAMM|nr:DUF2333 family protein [Marinobacterium marinum]MBA4501403.1 DUF2333 family protein [Marinobacterium marinum]